MKTLTRDDVITQVAAKTGFTYAQVHQVLETVLDTVQQALVDQRKVEFRNFGSLRPAIRKARTGRNPQDVTQVYSIPARRVVRFKPGAHLDTALNPTL